MTIKEPKENLPVALGGFLTLLIISQFSSTLRLNSFLLGFAFVNGLFGPNLSLNFDGSTPFQSDSSHCCPSFDNFIFALNFHHCLYDLQYQA
jgi:hypothetical protein